MSENSTNTKLYVGGLAYSVGDSELENLFSEFGNVISAKVVTEYPNTTKSKGFGFVEMSNTQEADLAIQKLNGSVHKDRTITVSPARPKERGGDGDRGRGGYGGGGGRSGGGYGGGGNGRSGGGDGGRGRGY